MKRIFTVLCICLSTLTFGQILNETFDDASGFTTSEGFFSDGTGDYFGLGSVNDFGGDTTPSGIKAYTGFTGGFLTGMDLDGEGASLPITVNWTSIDITGFTNLEFSGQFAEFFDSPGDIDPTDFILLEYQIDGGGFQNLLSFVGADFSTSVNGIFREDTNFDGTGDGSALGDAASTFVKSIAGTGATLDLRLTVSLNAGDEDFAADTFVISGISSGNVPVITCPMDIVIPAVAGTCAATANYAGSAIDIEDGDLTGSIVSSIPSGSSFPVGTTPVTLSVTDSDGNTVSCMFNVTVEDQEDPVVSCMDITVQLDTNGMVTVPAIDVIGSASDNCGIVNTLFEGLNPEELNTGFAGGNGAAGNMFDMVAINDLTMDSFDVSLEPFG